LDVRAGDREYPLQPIPGFKTAGTDAGHMSEEAAREYYRAIDEGDYEALRAVLAEGFRQERGDRTLDDREEFLRFMRDDRPQTDTTHVVDAVYERAGGVAVEGRLLRADGSEWFAFVDAFDVEDERLTDLRTYTRS
jgi:ketosteroid isomerase-like protein